MHRSVHDDFVSSALRERVAVAWCSATAWLDTTDVGPVINDKAVETHRGYAAIGRDEAELVIGGEPAREGALARAPSSSRPSSPR